MSARQTLSTHFLPSTLRPLTFQSPARQTLSTPETTAFINQNFVIWGGSLEASEPFVVSESISTSTFPFVALLLCGHSEGPHCLERVEGAASGPALVERLTQAMQRHQASCQPIVNT